MSLRRFRTRISIAIVFAAAIGRGEKTPAGPQTETITRGDLEFAVVEDGRADRVVLRVEIDGRALRQVWDEAFQALFAFYDRDRSQTLSQAEAEQLPSAVRVRQLSWGYYFTAGDGPIAWAELCGVPEASEIGPERLIAFYRACGIGVPALAVDREPGPNPAEVALRKALDADGDDRITEHEFSTADAALARLDLNQDEVVSADEL
ncbi:MAG TPA: hypothetical protein VFX03_01975, partial [Thermomicrobiales bacterium]|nr:hypothetical protein [Thermomicrobiales bacterium]